MGTPTCPGASANCFARPKAFSDRTPVTSAVTSPVKLDRQDLELIDRLVRHDRTAVSTRCWRSRGRRRRNQSAGRALPDPRGGALGPGEGAVTSRRAEQIARHVKPALGRGREPMAA
jgi:hypothetical protein